MLLVADVHGARQALADVAGMGEKLLVLGDLINFIDYRTYEGIAADLLGLDTVREMVELRARGRFDEARGVWGMAAERHGGDLWADHRSAIAAAYDDILPVLEGSGAVVTYGNVDNPKLLAEGMPPGSSFLSHGVVEVEGWTVGIVGGGSPSPLDVPGEVSNDVMSERLAGLGPVEVLCTHVPPAIPQLEQDTIGGRNKGSQPVLDYIIEHQPAYHFFGDIHQPQATAWPLGRTASRNVGYFRATGRAVRLPPRR